VVVVVVIVVIIMVVVLLLVVVVITCTVTFSAIYFSRPNGSFNKRTNKLREDITFDVCSS
jgi:uncharacterized membrane protein (DUF485 family)